jgi:hypothetical protein
VTKTEREQEQNTTRGDRGRMEFSTVNEWAGRIGKEVPCFHLRPIFSHPQVNDVYR